MVYVAPMNNWCKPSCKIAITTCGTAKLGPITGLGYDSCRDMLYATDGKLTVYGVVSNCQFKPVGCCPALGEKYTGLAVRPRAAQSVGKSCTRKPCFSCPSTRNRTRIWGSYGSR